MSKICEYGCGQEAKYQFKNKRWCCSENSNQCPARRKMFSEIKEEKFPNTKRGRMMEQLEKGKAKCKYCGEKANYLTHHYIFSCTENCKDCKCYIKFIGDERTGLKYNKKGK